jgi:amino acid adenylation domain-containing protein
MKDNSIKNDPGIREKLIENYWVEKISGIDQGVTGFSASPRDDTRIHHHSIDFKIHASIYERIKGLAKNNEMTEYIIYLSFFCILLFKYYKQSELLISTPGIKPISNNNSGECFLFYRLNVNPFDSIKNVLRKTRSEIQESLPYKDFNYNQLKSILEREGIDAYPLYRFGFFDDRINEESPEFEKVELQWRFETAANQKYQVRITFNEAQFETGFVRQMASHYQNLLQVVHADKGLDHTVGEIQVLSPGEKHQLLFDFNDTAALFPADKTLIHLFEQQVERSPYRVALRFEERAFTYKEINERTNRLAHYLRKSYKIEPDDLIGILLKRSEWTIIALLGILKSSAAYLPLCPDYPSDRIQYIVEDACVKTVLLNNNDFIERFQLQYYDPLVLGENGQDFSNEPEENLEIINRPHNLAYIIFTSGSTGAPKGVLVEHFNVIRLLFNDRFQFDFNKNDIWTLFHSTWFDFSVWELFGALLVGAQVVVVPEKVAQTPRAFLKLLEDQKITVLNQIPTIFNHLSAEILKDGNRKALSLRYVIFGGDALNPSLLKAWYEQYPEVKLVNMYGITETTVHVTYKEIKAEEIAAGKSNIGTPIPTLSCYVMDDQLQLESIGKEGEIVVGGAGVSRGYLNRPELTREKFIPNPYVPGERLYRSGDLGKRRSNGDIEFLGRMDKQVKIRGFRIECGEIESQFIGFETIKEAVIIAKEDKDNNKYLAAYFTAGKAVSSTACREHLEKILPQYMIPAFFIQLERFPLTATGKIDKKALPDPEFEYNHVSGALYEAPRNKVEAELVRIWQEVLGIEKIGINDNFFSLGGNSIRGIHVVNKIQEWLEEIVHVTLLFEAPTVRELAEKLETYRIDSGLEVDEAKVAKMRQIITPLAPLNRSFSKNPPAVFILSPPRSGTTLLRVILAGHPELFAPPELELLSFNTLTDRKKVLSGKYSYFTEGALRAIMEIKNCNPGEAESLMRELETQGSTSQQFYGKMQQWLGNKRLVDKTPWYSLDIDILKRAEDYFEAPQYIHLLRNPYAVIHSFEEAKLDQIFRYDHDFSVRQLAELVWLICHQNILEFFKAIPQDRKYTVKFEELVQNTKPVVQGICDFLGIHYFEEMVKVYDNTKNKMLDGIHPESKMLGDIKFFEHRTIEPNVTDKWKTNYKKDFLGVMTVELARSFGYLRERVGSDFSEIEAAPESEYYELSHAQKRLWILDQIEEDHKAYNIHEALLLEGDLNIHVLTKSYETEIRRHQSLRTTFIRVDEKPRQKIHDFETIGYQLEHVDLRREPDREEQAKILANQEAEASFDLEKGPLLRTKLIQLEEKRYLFLFTMHHIICDGWSMHLLINELFILYDTYKNNKENPLPPLRLQYKDYSEWQNSKKGKKMIEQQETYWLREFEGEIPLLNLPTDFPRPDLQSFEGSDISFELGEEETKQLKMLAVNQRVTLYMVLLSIFTVFLSKITGGKEDIVVGTGIAGRRDPELQRIIGMFVNTLALRNHPSGEKTFQAFLNEVKAKTLKAFENQDYPFDTLVQKVVENRDMGRNPLVEAVLLLQNMEVEAGEITRVEIPEIKRKPYDNKMRVSLFDIMFFGAEVGEKLFFTVQYCTKLFKEETIQRFISYFKEIVSTVIDNPEIKLEEIYLSSDVSLIKSTVLQEETGDFGF